MRKRTLLGLAAALAAVPAVVKAVQMWNNLPEEETAEPNPEVKAENIVSFPLKNKLINFEQGEINPHYILVLETPDGVKEFPCTQAHYETYYIGDEVICLADGKGGYSVV